jgi:hypothetical protein
MGTSTMIVISRAANHRQQSSRHQDGHDGRNISAQPIHDREKDFRRER